jgi:hypothetical protein
MSSIALWLKVAGPIDDSLLCHRSLSFTIILTIIIIIIFHLHLFDNHAYPLAIVIRLYSLDLSR